MPKIAVMNRSSAYKYQFKNHEESSIIISITDVDAPYNHIHSTHQNGIKAVLELKFDDVDKGWPNCITTTEANKITNFINTYKNKVDVIIVHCEAGISRSAGVAAAIMKHLDGNDMPIFNSPKYCPNMTCYRLVLNSFIEKELNIDGR